jgi:uncharacterized protein YndB with AHSA1/START domain
MRQHTIDVDATSSASPEAVFDLLTDGTTWPNWSSIESFELERAGDPPPEGVGAIRIFRRGRTTGRDEVREVVPHRRFVYASLSGLPTRDYVGEIDLDECDGATHIHWHASYRPQVPGTGWMLDRGLRRFLQDCARGLAEYAASSQHATP